MNNKTTKTMKKNIFLVLVFSLISFVKLQAQDNIKDIQSISIEQCYEWSKANYPITQQMEIIDKTTAFNIKNASNGNLPQISLNGQATYQSAVTKLPISIPNMTIPSLSKDQYKTYASVYQSLTNFNKINTQKKLTKTKAEIEKQQLEIDFLKLKDRINQIFFGTLLISEKNEQLQIIKSDIDSALVRIQAAIDNGTATTIDKQLLEVEKITLDQKIDENNANQTAFLKMLSTLTGKNITTSTTLIHPQSQPLNSTIKRPELQLFSLQNQTIDFKKKQLNNSLIPNVGIFGQAGYGRPALNFLSNEFQTYYIGGIKLNWNISGFYSLKSNRKLLDLANERIEAQKKAFLLKTNLTQSQQTAEVEKYQDLLLSDKKIIVIRQNVDNTAKVQLENGLITTIDYIKILNDLNKAKQIMLLHETQLLLAQQNLKNTAGN